MKTIRIAGALLFLGVVGFVTYVYLEFNATMKELNGSKSWYNEGEAYLIDEASSLHLHDTYYVVFDQWLVVLTMISIFLLIAPAKVVSLFRRKRS